MSWATGDSLAGWWSTKWRSPTPSKNAMPQPSAWWSVLPPRCAKPEKLNVTSVGVLQFIPSSWHMKLFCPQPPRRDDRQCADECEQPERFVESRNAPRARRRVGECVAMRRDSPFQEDPAQADAGRAAQHAQEIDRAGALRDERVVQRAHRADVQRRQDEAQTDAPEDGPRDQQRNRM